MNKFRSFALLLMSTATSLVAQDLIELSYTDYIITLLIPRQIATCDCIFAGTVISNNADNLSSQFSITETLYGFASSSNVTIRAIGNSNIALQPNSQYLVFSYTNNWSSTENPDIDDFVFYSSCRSTITNVPSFFNDYRILDPNESAINFSRFTVGGTNFWEHSKTIITNFIDITRNQKNESAAFMAIDNIITNQRNTSMFPKWFISQFVKYRLLWYNGHAPVEK